MGRVIFGNEKGVSIKGFCHEPRIASTFSNTAAASTANDHDHHALGPVMLLVKAHQVFLRDLLNGLGVAIFGFAVGMVFEKKAVEGHGGHFSRVLGANGEGR